ncbi:MAG: recombinase family protein [Acidimicrobiales bacterium]
MWRVALYARQGPARQGRHILERQVTRLAAHVARQPGWRHVATYADQSVARPWRRPGMCRLLADAPWSFDVVVVESYGQLSPNRRDLDCVLGQLAAVGVHTVVLPPRAGRRLATLVANLALADLVGDAVR